MKGQAFAVNDQLVVEATVTSGGQPASGASVSFIDSFKSTFAPSTAATNSTGVAVSELQIAQRCGTDMINASVSIAGSTSTQSTSISVACSSTQLDVDASVQNNPAVSGSTNIISGYVYLCCYSGVGGAAVTVSDTIGSSFYTQTVQTSSNGYYSTNFTLGAVGSSKYDFITVTTLESGYSGSSSTIYMTVNPSGSNYLTVVENRFLPSTLSTFENRPYVTSAVNDQVVVETTVTAGGQPVSGASVGFTDGFSSTFAPATVKTNSSGVALTEVQIAAKCGIDVVTASASVAGRTGIASNTIYIACSSTQLDVDASVQNNPAVSGSTNIISGYVYLCCYSGVGGAAVTVSDTIGSSFYTESVQTSSNGFYSINFTLGNVDSSKYDLITVTASKSGYSDSSSTIYMTVNPSGSNYLTVVENRFLPSTLSTFENRPYVTSAVNDQLIVEATVTSGGQPVSGASVGFTDGFSSTFAPATVKTNSSGVALTEVQIAAKCGIDVVTASASVAGRTGIASNTIYIACSSTQLDLSGTVSNNSPNPGVQDAITGYVYLCCYSGVGGAAVTVSDTIGSSFYTQTTVTDKNGHFAINFTVGNVENTLYDFVTISASENGYSGSNSTIYLVVSPKVTTVTSTQSTNTFSSSSTTSSLPGTVTSSTMTTSSSSTETTSSLGPNTSSTNGNSTSTTSSSGSQGTSLPLVLKTSFWYAWVLITIVILVPILIIARGPNQSSQPRRSELGGSGAS